MTSAKTITRYGIGMILGAVALWASLRSVSHAAVADAMHAASLSWTVAALATTFITLAFVTWRWGVLLGLAGARNWGRLWNAVVIGQAVNIIFPLRFGEVARVASMSRSTAWPIGRVAMALAIERVFDVAAFGSVVLLLVMFGTLPAQFAGPVPTMMLVVALTLLVAIAAVMLLPRLVRALGRRAESGVAKWILKQAAGAQQAWQALQPARVVGAILMTGLALASSASTNYLVFRAFDLRVPVVAALVLLAVLQVGTAVVSVPGNVGVFQYLTVLTLASWSIGESTALAVSIVLHVVSLGTRVALGAIAAVFHTSAGRGG